MIRLLILFLLCQAAFGAKLTQRSFLVSFPDIGFDNESVVFANDKWAAVYANRVGAMFTVPRDSLAGLTLNKTGREGTVIAANATYSCSPVRGNALTKQDAYGTKNVVLQIPGERALQVLADAWHMMSVTTGEVSEEIGPLCAASERIWFGLIAYHGGGIDPIAGLGWYDTRTENFGRIYSDGLFDLAPKWIGAREDTIWLFSEPIHGRQSSKLVGYSVYDGTLTMLDPRGAGIPGDTLLNVALWGDNFLLTTEQSVCVWPKDHEPWVWQTDAYAARDSVWLQFVTFDQDKGKVIPGGDFFPLIKNQPAQAFALVGDWIELLCPRGIEAIMYHTHWENRKDVLTGFDWGCGDEVCSQRVKIEAQGEPKEMDLLDTPLVYIKGNASRVRVGMQAGWIRLDKVVPVLMKK